MIKWPLFLDNEVAISFNSQNNDMMTGGAQACLRPSLIPLFSRDKKDEKRNEGKREEPLKTWKGLQDKKENANFANNKQSY